MTDAHEWQQIIAGMHTGPSLDRPLTGRTFIGIRVVNGKHRGIKLKSYHERHRGFRELLGASFVVPEPGLEPADPTGVTPKQVLARRLREELEEALGILDQALSEAAPEKASRKRSQHKP